MRNWDDLKFCHALYRHGTMSDAAKVLNTNVATVSRRLHRLSEEIGETLFIKEGNRWVLTEAGLELAHIAEQLQLQIDRANASDRETDLEVKIRINCPVQLVQSGLADGLAAFFDQHPRVSFRFETQKRSLALNECDVRLDFEEPSDGRIVRRLLTKLDFLPVCGRGYADRLTNWVNVIYTEREGPQSRVLREYFGAAPKVEVEGLNLARALLSSNPFVAILPRQRAASDPQLEVVCGIGPIPPIAVWLSFHESRRRDPAVRLAIEFIESTSLVEEAYPPVAAAL